jgi:hypothetical protein
MEYLNRACIEGIAPQQFKKQQPYPWVSMAGSLTPEGFEILRTTMPDVGRFEKHENKKRAYGQGPHNRYILHYRPGIELPEPWKEFVDQLLHGETYQSFLRRMLGPRQFILTLEWYYAWQGCSVSPHCDARRKLATHIFYFNTDKDWQPNWGGKILILDDDKRWKTHSAPKFDDLKVAAALEPWGNASLLFERTPHSWHGVRPLECPPDTLRKLFIVTINVPTLQVWWRKVRGKDPDGFRIRA